MTKSLRFLLGMLSIMAVLTFTSCDEDPTPAVTQENEQPDGLTQTRFSYTVQVISTAVAGGRTNGVTSATVTIQQNGNKQTLTTDSSGIVVFNGLNPGQISVFVSASGHATYNFNTTLSEDPTTYPNVDRNQNVQLNASDRVDLPVLGGKIRGILQYNNGDEVVPAANVAVRFTIDRRYSPNSFLATTDAEGVYNFSGLPVFSGELRSDTVLNVKGENILYSFVSTTTPSLIDTRDVGVVTMLPSSTPSPVVSNGTVRVRLWEEVDGYYNNNSGNYNPTGESQNIISSTPAVGTLVTAPFLEIDDDDYPSNQPTEFAGTFDATTNAWTFANVPTGYNMDIKLVYTVDRLFRIYGTGGNSECIETNDDDAITPGFTNCSDLSSDVIAQSVSFTKTFTFLSTSNAGQNISVNENQTLDLGWVRLN